MVFGAFGMGLFNFFVLLPISIALSPFFLTYMLYANCYWFAKYYIL